MVLSEKGLGIGTFPFQDYDAMLYAQMYASVCVSLGLVEHDFIEFKT